jgi:drug/metabolite transporter (DMT)-like permease
VKIVGIILLVVGALIITYQGFTYKTHKKVLDLGPVQATKEERHTVPIPPILGAIAVIGGIVVLTTGRRN